MKIFILIASLIGLGLCISGLVFIHHPSIRNHQCIDQTHLSCDGNCECDGLECGPYIIHPQHCMCEFCIEATDSGSRDYIIMETKDSIYTYNQENLLIDAYSIHNNKGIEYDYLLNVHYDTAWLYANNGELVSVGHFDSIPELINKNNQ